MVIDIACERGYGWSGVEWSGKWGLACFACLLVMDID